ncbi:DUF4286 family protein [Paracandidimonas soli]|uniref:Uncharacterized protein n=1 Tax=Paracandidimonas soli TaxID=1917182 RepID=A0A4R3UTQ4_9BURK|nr:DUF4286 family protein [Paracandidimonas soli]TCU94482.1 hypothetical protein EV686_10933 [Paracandidimonas soli]
MNRQWLLRIPVQRLNWKAIDKWPLDRAVLATAQLHHAVDHPETYVRLFTDRATDLAALLQQACPSAQAHRLTLMQSIAGPANNQPAAWFYTVETDITPEVETDFNRWYSEEHLPGLAAVDGTVRAERWLCETGSPRYVASYELASRETFGCPAWLAVRGTPWSDRIRPHFIHAKRTLFTTSFRSEPL